MGCVVIRLLGLWLGLGLVFTLFCSSKPNSNPSSSDFFAGGGSVAVSGVVGAGLFLEFLRSSSLASDKPSCLAPAVAV